MISKIDFVKTSVQITIQKAIIPKMPKGLFEFIRMIFGFSIVVHFNDLRTKSSKDSKFFMYALTIFLSLLRTLRSIKNTIKYSLIDWDRMIWQYALQCMNWGKVNYASTVDSIKKIITKLSTEQKNTNYQKTYVFWSY